MSVGVFLLAFGLPLAVSGAWVSLNIRGSAASLERWAATNAELRMQAQGNLGPARTYMSAAVFRVFGSVIGAASAVLALAGLAELLV
ncbi:hypothetical protein ACFWBF_29625 [Streptomyces sp. NPDC060028]|uniref:hypothetical protein n=1 Tax=Streptomyces sp. NPDC060028 TaxID=3347041 RepID=UPI00367FBD7E